MVDVIRHLSTQVPIVRTDGTPTPYFARLLEEISDAKIASSVIDAMGGDPDADMVVVWDDATGDLVFLSISDLLDWISSTTGHILYRDGAEWVGLSISDILDTIDDTHGAILFRGASDWEALAPGADGDVLTTHDVGADPTWETPSVGGGGSDWIDLTFSTSSAVKWQGHNWFESDQSITLTSTDKLEMVLGCDRDSTELMHLAISPDGQKCYTVFTQADNNYVLYRYATSGGAQTVLSGGVVSQARSGHHAIRMTIYTGKSGSTNQVVSWANTSGKMANDNVSNIDLAVSTNKVWIVVPNDSLANIKYCKYRINSPTDP